MTCRIARVHYVTPFGSPAWIPGWQADTYLEQDDRRWARLQELEMVSKAQRVIGPPHIDDGPARPAGR